MKTKIKNVLELAKPYLNTRKNDVHTEISIKYAFKLLEKEDGNVDVVIPAIILHDVGWIRIPKELQLKAFGPKATSPQLKSTRRGRSEDRKRGPSEGKIRQK